MQVHLSCNLQQLLNDGSAPRKLLGKGGYGRVFEQFVPCPSHIAAAACASGHPEYVAKGVPIIVKEIAHTAASPAELCEAEAAACIAMSSSRYLPRLYHHLHGDTQTVLVFEAVSSRPQNLAQRVRACAAAVDGSQHLPLGDMIGIQGDLAEGLQDMHSLDWCHADVKAENMVLGEDRAYLVDLGLARKVGEGLIKGRCVGTAGYIDPLMVWYAGKRWPLKMAACFDWWSAGMVLVYMLVKGNDQRFDEVAEIAAEYCPIAEGFTRLDRVRKVLEPEVASVVGRFEQELWQQGKLQQGMQLVGVREGLLHMVEGLLQRSTEYRWSHVEVLDMVKHLVGLMNGCI
jgi:serine/threonine protein kinase